LVNHLIHAFSLPTNKNGHSSLCTSCSKKKAHRQTFSTHGLTSTTPIELIYTDVWGPSHDLGIKGSKYYVIFVDHYTKYIWLYPMTHKSNVQPFFHNFVILWKIDSTQKLKVFILIMVGNMLVSKLIFLSMALVITLLLLTLPNKMVCLKGDIAT
jgi:hypothetical protein